MATTSSGKKLKKCSTAGWDREKKAATGCTYVEWVNAKKGGKTQQVSQQPANGDETAPDFEV
jgi:hypothetical protein